MMNLQTFIRHAKKVTCQAPETRPLLKGILYEPNGDAFVTDSHRLYWVKNIHHFKERTVIAPNHRKIKGNYPDVTRLIPRDFRESVTVSTKELLQHVDLLHSVGSVRGSQILRFTPDMISFKNPEVVGIVKYKTGISERFHLNSEYIRDALKLFSDAKYETVSLHFNGPIRPIVLQDEQETLTALILPVRTY